VSLVSIFVAPPKQFELAFKMFDDNGDGNLDQAEYERVSSIKCIYKQKY